ncbi:MAG: hypothetical protein IAF58_01950 [Leptolyngbya sp.]|nr:hypothetical protein [Candidatus Melainabacteria bacterium]
MTVLKSESDNSSAFNREVELFSSLKDNLWNEVTDYLTNNKAAVATEAVIAAGMGLGIAAMSKNPAVFGAKLAPVIKSGLPIVGKVGIGIAATDWAFKVGAPAYDVWQDPDSLEKNKGVLGKNVGGGLVDYTVGGVAGIAGGVAGWKFTKDFVPNAPEFDLKPSLSLNETPRNIANIERFTTAKEGEVKPDVVRLYEKSFPKEERQPTEEVAALVKDGRIMVHTTRAEDGKLEAFSFVSHHDEGATKFAGLDFVATEEASRSSGVGSLHLKRLNESIKTDHPDYVAMTLEMEHPMEAGLAADELATRLRRAKFYDRLDAPNTNIKYNIIDFEDPSYRGMAQHRAFVYKPQEFNAVKAAHTFMTDEGGYQLGKLDVATKEFNLNNGYWEPLPFRNLSAVTPAYVSQFFQQR